MDSCNPNEGSDSQNIASKAAALLLVIGEPFTEDHKKLILDEVTKGFGCWETEASGIDINDELAQIANKADLGEEGPDAPVKKKNKLHKGEESIQMPILSCTAIVTALKNKVSQSNEISNEMHTGERIIRQCTENFVTEVLVNPQTQTLTQAVKNFLATPTKHKQLIHAGHAFQGSGAWILQDDTYTANNFVQAFKDQDVSNSLKQQEGSSLYIYTGAGGDWTDSQFAGKDFAKSLKVKVNPSAGLDNVHGVLQFTAYISNFVRVRKLNELLQSTDVVGNIRFSRPTLYIFPGCQGDSALFGMSGFNLLVNGGYSRKACFWDFTRHLDRIDAALVTHLGTDNLFGFSSVLQRKSTENVHPEIGYMYINASDKIRALTEPEPTENKETTLSVNLAEEGNKLIQYAKQIGQFPQPCTRNTTIEPITLYHKVGIGSMDMYILNPITDSKELKEFYQQWNQKVAQFGKSQHWPLPNNLSVCALLVWRPSDPNDNITRIFFPGNAPQHKVLEGLEKLKTLNILKTAKCTHASLNVKPAAKKPTGLASRPATRSKISPLSTPKNESPSKLEPAKKTAAAPPKPRPTSAQKAKKEDSNTIKKTSKVGDKVMKNGEKTDKSKSPSSSSPSKSSVKSSAASTPKETASPVKDPEPVPTLIDSSADILKSEVNGGLEQAAPPAGFSAPLLEPEPAKPAVVDDLIGAPLPPQELMQPEQPQHVDTEKLKEMGIYDEDQDIEEDLNAQQNEKPEEDRVPAIFGGMTDSMHENLMDDMKPADSMPMQSSFHGDLMSGSMHESIHEGMFDNKYDGFVQNGEAIQELPTPDDDTSEEIQPQALPEPLAYTPASYGQEPDVIPVVAVKEESEFVAEKEVSPVSMEPDLVPTKQEVPDDISLSQGVGEESTVPIEDKMDVQSPPQLETPDEVENALPEDAGFGQPPVMDVEEKDKIEENEKEIVSFEDEKVEAGVEEKQPENEDITSSEDEQVEAEVEEKQAKNEKEIISFEDEQVEAEVEEKQPEMAVPVESDNFDQMAVNDVPEADQVVAQTPAALFMDTATQEVEEQKVTDEQESEVEKNLEDDLISDEIKTADTDIVGEVQKTQESLLDVDESPSSQQLTDDFVQSTDMEFDQSLEPELVGEVSKSEPQEALPEMERPKTPEPSEAEQDAKPAYYDEDEQVPVDKDVAQEVSQPAIEAEPSTDNSGDNVESDLIENDYVEEVVDKIEPQESKEVESAQPASLLIDNVETAQPSSMLTPDELTEQEIAERKEKLVMPEVPADQQQDVGSLERAETPDSQDERADTPDSQVGAGDMNRDSLEREQVVEKSPSPVIPVEQRDSIEREVPSKEASPAVGDEHSEPRDSIERSFEVDDDTDESDDETDEDEDSSSFEQEENTDEKYLIPDSLSEDQRGQQLEEDKLQETDSLAAPPDSLLDQPSDNLISPASENMYTPESEITDPSHGGQLGYHQMGEHDDADSIDGLEDKNELSPQQPPLEPVQIGQDHGHFGQDSGPMSNPTNPFDIPDRPGFNPFTDTDQQQPQQALSSSDEEGGVPSGGPADFNPVTEWGEPMGLPSPAPPEDKNAATGKTSRPKSATKTDTKKTDTKTNGTVKKTELRKPAAAATTKKAAPTSRPSSRPSNGEAEKPKTTKSSASSTSKTSRLTTPATTGRVSLGGRTATAPKPRPTSAPTKDKIESKSNDVKRPSTAAGTKSSQSTVKMPPLPPFTPFYMDLTYIPNHGNTQYSDVEFFKRVRARYYVLSTLSPNTQVLDALLDAKNTWEDKELQVTVIPTYDNETLRLWMALHKDKLADHKVDIAPSANRCTIQLQDHETSCSAYRLEF